MKPTTIFVLFTDFWEGFDPHHNIFTEALRKNYTVEVLDEQDSRKPQLLIYSAFGSRHIAYDCIKLYYTGENDVPDFNQCDYAISSHFIELGDRHMRLPQYTLYKEFELLNMASEQAVHNAFERDFCSVVVSNSTYAAPERIEIIDHIEQYKPLAYGGKFRNNVGGRVPDKMAFIARYKFNIALENSLVDGYTTEKLIEPMAAQTIPIYWGNRMVDREFNAQSYINISDYDNYNRAVKAIERLDNDREAYMQMLCAPKLHADNNINWGAQLQSFLSHIIANGQRYIYPYGIIGHMQYMQQRKELLYDNTFLRKCASAWIKWRKKK